MANCKLCPRKCGANRKGGELGTCGAPAKIKVALTQLHMWEEPTITGENGSGTIFFSHCPLKCIYCQNSAISSGGKGEVVSIEELQNMMLNLQEKGAENINFVTGTQWSPEIVQAVKGIKTSLKIPIVWNTSSYETPETIAMLNEIVDIYLADFKYYSNTLAKQLSSAPNYREVATTAISTMLPRRVIVRHLVLPGHTDDSKLVLKHVNDTFGNKVRFSIMNQFTPVNKISEFPELNRTLSKEEYEEVLDFADSIGISDYFWQEGETCKESFIPNF